MKFKTEKYDFIVIEGNIGAGKTTLCSMLAEDFNCRLVLEEFSDNPFLPLFYENQERHAFAVELFFMAERHKQLENLLRPELFQQTTIADYYFVKTLLFAKKNLKGNEFRLFQRFHNILNKGYPKPQLLVYLHQPVPKLLKNIQERGRPYELEIPAEYLLQIQDAYFEYFRTDIPFPVVILDLEDADFVTSKKQYQEIIRILNSDFDNGVHRVKVE